MTLSGFCFIAALVTLAVPVVAALAIALTIESGRTVIEGQIYAAAPPLAWTLGSITATIVFQMVLNLCIFFTGPRSNKWLRHRWWYALYECTRHAACPRAEPLMFDSPRGAHTWP